MLELLRNEPELLAVADAIVATHALDLAPPTSDSGRMVSDDEAEISDAR
ncbi:MAG TPA: hypothetical protein VNK94_07765 [Gaiellaceae bacterium]|nr:hypothetical protein [Gaiellaceae bacterium]